MIEVLKQAIDYIENVPDDRDGVGHIDRHALVAALKERLAQPEPILSLQCFHCQDTIETLNDKVMHLLAQRTEQNFCPRCGKRTKDLTHIHTCTPPPREGT